VDEGGRGEIAVDEGGRIAVDEWMKERGETIAVDEGESNSSG